MQATPDDDLILAALERAELHSRHDEPGVLYRVIVDHLGLRMGSATGRVLRPRITALAADGLVVSGKRLSAAKWTLTREGRDRLEAARADGRLGELPESPQHRDWRVAREAAAERIGGFRGALRLVVGDTAALLERTGADSEAWSQIGERLARDCKRLSSATYCLREWAEPGDDAADADDRNQWRRNTSAWDLP
jgi:hypothetical protein